MSESLQADKPDHCLSIRRPSEALDRLFAVDDESSRIYVTHHDSLKRWCAAVGVDLVVIETDFVDRAFLASYDIQHARAFSSQSRRCERFVFFRTGWSDERLAEVCGGTDRDGSSSGHASTNGETLETLDALFAERRTSSKDDGVEIRGWVVKRPTQQSLGRSYLSLPEHSVAEIFPHLSADRDHFVLSLPKQCYLAGRRFDMPACVPFVSQDGFAAACASAALWMALEIQTSSRLSHLSPAMLTRAAHDRHAAYGIYERGLSPVQLSLAIQEVGFQPLVTDPTRQNTWNLTLTWMIDSRIPCVVGLKMLDDGAGHAVTIMGHDGSAVASDQDIYWGQGRSSFLVLDDARAPFVRMEFLAGARRARTLARPKIRRMIEELGLSAANLVVLDDGHDRVEVAGLQTLVAAIPPAVQPIRQDLSRDAPRYGARAASALLATYASYLQNRFPEIGTMVYELARAIGVSSLIDTDENDWVERPQDAAADLRRDIATLRAAFTGMPESVQRDQLRAPFDLITRALHSFLLARQRELDGRDFRHTEALETSYVMRPFLVPANAYKQWLCSKSGATRPVALTRHLRDLPMPGHVYLVELIRKHDLSDLVLDRDDDADPSFGRTQTVVHGEILLDPTWSEAHVLAAWIEDMLLLPKRASEHLHKPVGIDKRFESDMRPIRLDFENGARHVLSWFHNREHWEYD
ncbi:MAG: hypothetical protein AAGD38_23365 [Acidobacteriota bacterium]